jgi:hypothetical protein
MQYSPLNDKNETADEGKWNDISGNIVFFITQKTKFMTLYRNCAVKFVTKSPVNINFQRSVQLLYLKALGHSYVYPVKYSQN